MRRLRVVTLVSLTIGLAVNLSGMGTWAAFTSSTSNTGNSFSTGTVVISDNDSDVAMLSLSGAKPGDSNTDCISVSYTGSLAANVKLYLSSLTGTGLETYLQVVVTQGTNTSVIPMDGSCTGFVAGTVLYSGSGGTTSLAQFPTTYAAGLDDAVVWAPGNVTPTVRVYRIVVTVIDDPAAQGLNATAGFTWQANNT